MQTNDINSSYDDNSNKDRSGRTFLLGTAIGLAAAAALGAAFVLGGGGGGGETAAPSSARPAVSATSPATQAGSVPAQDGGSTAGSSDAAPGGATGTGTADGGEGGETAPTETPVVEEPTSTATPEPEEPTVTPTATPDGECAWCPEGLDELGVEPTPIPPGPCLLCDIDLDMVLPIDVAPPVISNIETTFCFPVLQVVFDLDAPAEVWFEYEYDGHTYASSHQDSDGEAYLADDMGGFGWGVYLINTLDIHAVDLSGNHAVSSIAMPDPLLGC